MRKRGEWRKREVEAWRYVIYSKMIHNGKKKEEIDQVEKQNKTVMIIEKKEQFDGRRKQWKKINEKKEQGRRQDERKGDEMLVNKKEMN